MYIQYIYILYIQYDSISLFRNLPTYESYDSGEEGTPEWNHGTPEPLALTGYETWLYPSLPTTRYNIFQVSVTYNPASSTISSTSINLVKKTDNVFLGG